MSEGLFFTSTATEERLIYFSFCCTVENENTKRRANISSSHPTEKNNKTPRFLLGALNLFILRREQDSNLRTGFAGYTLSRRASSTTRAPLQICDCKITNNY